MPTEKKTIIKESPKQSLLPGIITAGLFWAVYTLYLDDFLTNDLRLLSSIISENILNILGADIQRNGTVLYNDTMKFEVIGACSGSTSLKVMLGAAIFLSISWRGLDTARRLIAILCSGVIAIICNGLRVTALVLLGLYQGHAVQEGVLHDIIGLLAFTCSFAAFIYICLRLGKSRRDSGSTLSSSTGIILQSLLLTIVLSLIFLPFLQDLFSKWAGSSWDRSNRAGSLYFFIPLLICILQSNRYHQEFFTRSGRHPRLYRTALILLTQGLCFAILTRLTGIVFLSGFGIILIIASLTLQYTDKRNTLLVSPLYIIMILSFPRIPLRLDNLTDINPELIRLTLSIVILLFQFLLRYSILKNSRQSRTEQKKSTLTEKNLPLTSFRVFLSCSSILTLTLLILLPAAQSNQHTQSTNSTGINSLDIPYYLKGFTGRDLPLLRSDTAYFGSNNILYREYKPVNSSSRDKVTLLITLNSGDRHRTHPPEFCQNGAGWRIESKDTVAPDDSSQHRVTLLRLKKGDNTKYMVYFFSTADAQESNYSKLMLRDIASRISGNEENWATVRVFSKSENTALLFSSLLPNQLFCTESGDN